MTIATDLERYMFDLVNEERTSRGLNLLQLEQNLNASADAHSVWMSRTDTFSHTGADSSSSLLRIREAGMDLSGSWGSAENIAAAPIYSSDGYLDEVDQLHRGLMNSPGHRANILNPALEYIGIGIALGPLTFSNGTSLPALLITQNFSYTDGIADLDLMGDAAGNTLRGAVGDDVINGNLGHDTIEGYGGDDILEGGNGFDVIYGGNGNDLIVGGSLGDRLYGDNGNDTVDGGFGRDTAFLGNGNDVFIDNGQGGWLGGDRVFAGNGVDRIEGGGGSDSFYGGGGNDVIFGGNGNDSIYGGSGGDRIFAGNNNDVVDGGFGRDTVFLGNGNDSFTDNGQTGWMGGDRVLAGNGNDTINASGGNDTLSGGADADMFIFNGDKIENDVITDYTIGVDSLHLDDALWDGELTQEQVIAQFAETSGGNTIFNFGGGNTITLTALADTTGLADDLILF
jgi:Ca2+-binding RTX toxin-like protein